MLQHAYEHRLPPAMPSPEVAEKVRENRLRRMADRQGYKLLKSRRRDARAVDYGGYMLVQIDINAAVLGAGAFNYTADLDEVEAFLTQSP